jgi:magnesium chelatase subunit D
MGGSPSPNRPLEGSSGDAGENQSQIEASAPPDLGDSQRSQGDGKQSDDKSDQFSREADFDRANSDTDISKILPTSGHVLTAGSGNRPTQIAPGFDRVKIGGSPLAVRETITNSLRRQTDGKLNSNKLEIDLDSSDLVFKRLLLLDERCVVFVVDTSGSMGSIKRVEAAKATIGKLLGDAYLKRHSVAMITFQGTAAETILMPTRSIEVANSRLSQIKRGGKTPLHLGLRKAVELAKRLRAKGTEPFVVVMTDGLVSTSQAGIDPAKATFDASRDLAEAKVDGLVVDFDLTDPKVGIGVEVAKLAKLSYISG